MTEFLNGVIKVFDISGVNTSVKLHKNIRNINYGFYEDKINVHRDFNKSFNKLKLGQKIVK